MSGPEVSQHGVGEPGASTAGAAQAAAWGVAAAEVERLREAGEWVQRLRDSTDASLSDEWLQWCQADSRNLAAFERMREVWEGFGVVGTVPARSRWVMRRSVVAACAALLLSVVAGVAVYGWRHSSAELLATRRGELHRAMLADGSSLELAPLSGVRLELTRAHREAWLQGGQVFFAVKHDRSRPFIVHAGGLRITAVGTAFDVRDVAGDVRVTVSEGRVNVSAEGGGAGRPPAPEVVQATAGERVTFSKSMSHLNLASVDVERAESWRNGVLQFVAQPLDEVVAEVSVYSPRPIVLGDAALKELKFTGTVSQAHLDDWLAALQAVFSVRIIDRGPDGIAIRAAAAPKG